MPGRYSPVVSVRLEPADRARLLELMEAAELSQSDLLRLLIRRVTITPTTPRQIFVRKEPAI